MTLTLVLLVEFGLKVEVLLWTFSLVGVSAICVRSGHRYTHTAGPGRGGGEACDIIVVKAVLAGFTSSSWTGPGKSVAGPTESTFPAVFKERLRLHPSETKTTTYNKAGSSADPPGLFVDLHKL